MPERFIEVSRWLIDTHHAVVVFVGAPHELSPFQGLFKEKRSALNWGGRTSVGEMAALFEMADAVVTLGSGPSHLAAAVKAPTLVIRSAQQPFGRWAHRQPHYEDLRKHVPCSPCDSPRCRNLLKPMLCMKLITVEEVKGVLQRMLPKGEP
jgi:ADP-heptose:LPS heptosyltransferase